MSLVRPDLEVRARYFGIFNIIVYFFFITGLGRPQRITNLEEQNALSKKFTEGNRPRFPDGRCLIWQFGPYTTI